MDEPGNKYIKKLINQPVNKPGNEFINNRTESPTDNPTNNPTTKPNNSELIALDESKSKRCRTVESFQIETVESPRLL